MYTGSKGKTRKHVQCIYTGRNGKIRKHVYCMYTGSKGKIRKHVQCIMEVKVRLGNMYSVYWK